MSSTDSHTDPEHLIVRYLAGELSPGEESALKKALDADPSLREQLEDYSRIWESVETGKRYDMDGEWERFRKRIHPPVTRSLLSHAYRIAAILVVGLFFASAYLYLTRLAGTEVHLAREQAVSVQLDDGSTVWLNRNSKLRVPSDMEKRGRQVRLRGEAWFDVSPDTERPFVVDAGPALVQVLGTRFNVNAYRANPTVELTVESGVVALSAKENAKEQIVLRSGNSGTYDPGNRELKLARRADPNAVAWKTREIYFDHTPLGEAVRVINRVYGKPEVAASPAVTDCPITVTFRDQSLESVISVLEATLNLEVSRRGGTILLGGTGCGEE